MEQLEKHWDKLYETTTHEKLGWFENDFRQTLKFIELLELPAKKTIFLPGIGTSKIVEELLLHFDRIILNDLSGKSLEILKLRLAEFINKIEFNNSDISKPLYLETKFTDLWLDRAVLHFLTTENEISGYFENLKKILKVGGYAIFAEFSKDGAKKCAGLELHQYDSEELTQKLGIGFNLIKSENYTFMNPSGEKRPYVYFIFKREN